MQMYCISISYGSFLLLIVFIITELVMQIDKIDL